MSNEIRVGIVGVGNCASALVQGVEYYKDVKSGESVPGLMHVNFGGYYIGDIKFVAAFDVNTRKIGKDLSQSIFAHPNSCAKFARVPELGVKVQASPIFDGVAPHMRRAFHCYDPVKAPPVNVVDVLHETGAEILINYLPVGSAKATRFFAQAALDARCAMINAIPEFVASDPSWAGKFNKAGLPVAGDDIKSQVGATILHRAIVELLHDRGVQVAETYQLNIGGNTDFLNMTVEERLKTKRVSKTSAVTSLLPYQVPVRIGPSDYVPFLKDKKICYVRVEGRKFGDLPLTVDVKLTVEDSPNSAGVVIDVIRATKIALERGISGALTSISAYAFKHPPIQAPDPVARQWVENFIAGKRER